MPHVTFISAGGIETSVEASVGQSLMEAARDHDVEGIEAVCGGVCACATCHVYISAEWEERLSAASPMEADMLECALDVKTNSRLSCQVRLSDELDGLIVNVPASQA